MTIYNDIYYTDPYHTALSIERNELSELLKKAGLTITDDNGRLACYINLTNNDDNGVVSTVDDYVKAIPRFCYVETAEYNPLGFPNIRMNGKVRFWFEEFDINITLPKERLKEYFCPCSEIVKYLKELHDRVKELVNFTQNKISNFLSMEEFELSANMAKNE